MFSGHSQQKYWIGLEMGASAYEWNDKSTILFENWGVNATKTFDCVSMKANGDWNDEDCALYRRPLCKKEDSEFLCPKKNLLIYFWNSYFWLRIKAQ